MWLKKEFVVFILVGISAAIVHLLIVWLLVKTLALAPLQANIMGFLVAVNVSYYGHCQFTFKQTEQFSVKKFTKFFSIAFLSFLVNQIAYFYGLQWFGSTFYLPILAIVLLLVAVFTFIFSKFWVFATHAPNSK